MGMPAIMVLETTWRIQSLILVVTKRSTMRSMSLVGEPNMVEPITVWTTGSSRIPGAKTLEMEASSRSKEVLVDWPVDVPLEYVKRLHHIQIRFRRRLDTWRLHLAMYQLGTRIRLDTTYGCSGLLMAYVAIP